MAGNPSVGEQLAGMLAVLRNLDQNNLSTSQSGELTLMSLVWPLLPLLPPHPPALLTELLREEADAVDKCDICGVVPAISAPVTSTGAELRHRPVARQKTSSLHRTMDVIEHRMDETLNSIEQTTFRSNELNKQTKDLNESGKSVMTDAELVNRLKSLVRQKETREKRVKVLETQEQQMKESLITAITWAKGVNPKEQNFLHSKDLKQTKPEEDILGQQHTPLQEGEVNEDIINIAQAELNKITLEQQNLLKEGVNEEDVYHQQEYDHEETITEVALDQQILEKVVSDVSINKRFAQDTPNDEKDNAIIIDLSVAKEEFGDKNQKEPNN